MRGSGSVSFRVLPGLSFCKAGRHDQRPCGKHGIDMPSAVIEDAFANFRVYLPSPLGPHSKEIVTPSFDLAVHGVTPQICSNGDEDHEVQHTDNNCQATRDTNPLSP